MAVDDPGLALRQSLAFLLVMPPLTGTATAVAGDGVVTGALMALTTAALNVRLGLFGDPERAGGSDGVRAESEFRRVRSPAGSSSRRR